MIADNSRKGNNQFCMNRKHQGINTNILHQQLSILRSLLYYAHIPIWLELGYTKSLCQVMYLYSQPPYQRPTNQSRPNSISYRIMWEAESSINQIIWRTWSNFEDVYKYIWLNKTTFPRFPFISYILLVLLVLKPKPRIHFFFNFM